MHIHGMLIRLNILVNTVTAHTVQTIVVLLACTSASLTSYSYSYSSQVDTHKLYLKAVHHLWALMHYTNQLWFLWLGKCTLWVYDSNILLVGADPQSSVNMWPCVFEGRVQFKALKMASSGWKLIVQVSKGINSCYLCTAQVSCCPLLEETLNGQKCWKIKDLIHIKKHIVLWQSQEAFYIFS